MRGASFFAMSCPLRSELSGALLDGKYRLLRPLGIGGNGVVFEAETLRDTGIVAVKVLKRDAAHHPDLCRRLEREARAGRELHHPGLLRTLDEGCLDDGSPYLVSERVRAESLALLLERRGPLPLQHALSISARLAAVLHAVHSRGYVHRDVKSEHVLLSRGESGELELRLIDFGVCLAPDDPPEQQRRERGRVFGTPGYVAPEQARGDEHVDGRADLFALGVVLFESLTGERPFSGPNVAVQLRRVLEERAPSVRRLRRDVPPDVERMLAQLLEPEAEHRPQNGRFVARFLSQHLPRTESHERVLARLLSPRDPVEQEASACAAETRDLGLLSQAIAR